jgi:hypothetical protein
MYVFIHVTVLWMMHALTHDHATYAVCMCVYVCMYHDTQAYTHQLQHTQTDRHTHIKFLSAPAACSATATSCTHRHTHAYIQTDTDTQTHAPQIPQCSSSVLSHSNVLHTQTHMHTYRHRHADTRTSNSSALQQHAQQQPHPAHSAATQAP